MIPGVRPRQPGRQHSRQEDLELLPKRGTTFDIKGLAGFSIEFKKDPTGKVTEAVFYQPDTVIVLKKKR